MAGHAQRRGREAGHRVEREPHHLAQRIIGLAGEPLGPVVGDRHLPEADPGDHAADEARLLGQAQQRVERAAAHQPEVAGVDRDVDVGELGEQPVEALGGRLLEHGLAGAGAAHGIDDVGLARLHLGDHLGEQLGRVLQIGVDDQDALARAQVEPGGQRELVAVVARQVDRDQPRVRRRQLSHHLPAAGRASRR